MRDMRDVGLLHKAEFRLDSHGILCACAINVAHDWERSDPRIKN